MDHSKHLCGAWCGYGTNTMDVGVTLGEAQQDAVVGKICTAEKSRASGACIHEGCRGFMVCQRTQAPADTLTFAEAMALDPSEVEVRRPIGRSVSEWTPFVECLHLTMRELRNECTYRRSRPSGEVFDCDNCRKFADLEDVLRATIAKLERENASLRAEVLVMRKELGEASERDASLRIVLESWGGWRVK